jgi:3-oxoacyl-[acyl-carrier protein] reductase
MQLDLHGRKALITGATKGIGRAIAEMLAAEGCDIAFCARTSADIAPTRASLERHGVRASGKAVDVTDAAALGQWIREVGAELGGLDILVTNPSAGNEVGEAGWKANYACDLMGTVRSVEFALPLLEKSQGASIVIIASTAALERFLVASAYNAVKAALIQYAGALAHDLGPKGIRVNAVSPGPIYIEGGAWEKTRELAPKVYEMVRAQVALGRLGSAPEIASQVALLASPVSGFTTGTNIVIDGGFTKRIQF